MILLALFALQQPQAPASPSSISDWQQDVAYEITARLDEPKGVLGGTERIQYLNRSPDTLETFSLHLHLNAFRPGSRWAAADSAEGRRRFNDLHDPDFGFNHVREVRIMGEPVEATYPFAPDSTIARFELPTPLLPGDSMTVEMAWDARPSTVPRRQGRQGRRFDFAQWYPKVVVYDRFGWEEHPLVPAGEFYGEFGRFTVDLDVPEDQVVGATGVPVCGDPGWERANRSPEPVDYQRDYYGAATPPADACAGADSGRKRIRWYAERVHHFAMSLNPEYRYEGGRFGDVAIHVLYQPGDEGTWGGGVAVQRTGTALAWLDRLFGPFGWPQITNVHRIEGGATEFPMMVHNSSADQGLIVHEVGHNYLMGLLANNEWREGWLDEGFTTFQNSWFWETMGRPPSYPGKETQVLAFDLDDLSEPPSLEAQDYRDFSSYSFAIYTRGELFFHQLRAIVGDEMMLRILRTFYERYRYHHVDEAAFRAVAEAVSHRDLSTFFAQWLHTTELYDYGIGKVRKTRTADGWTTRVEVVRKAPGRFPQDVAVIAAGDTAVTRTDGLAERETVELTTRTRPKQVILDPLVRSHDWNMLNNRRLLGFSFPESFAEAPGADYYLHRYFSTRSRRDRLTVGLQPVAWYNDAGGVTLGIRSRTDYLARFQQNSMTVTVNTGWGVDEDVNDADFYFRLRNPVFLRAPNVSQTLDAYNVEGRFGATAVIERTRRAHLSFGPTWTHAVALQWVQPDDFRYLDPGYYDDVGTVELGLSVGVATNAGRWDLSLRGNAAGGLAYHRDGLAASGRTDLDPFYPRLTLEATARRPLGTRLGLGVRAYAGLAGGDHIAAKQRQIYVQGSDPLERLINPFLRSRGSLLEGEDVNYQLPGGGAVRGVDPRVSTTALVALNVELERALLMRPTKRLFSRVSLAAFTDLAHGIGEDDGALPGGRLRFIGDAGVGLRAEHRIGDTHFVTRFDLPLWVSRPELAQDAAPDDDELAFRWVFSFQPEF